jgi:hypothetical protein
MELTPEQLQEHQEASRRPPVSGAYRGPHAVFTDEELRFILGLLPERHWEPTRDRVLQAVRAKVDGALTADPRLRLPLDGAGRTERGTR